MGFALRWIVGCAALGLLIALAEGLTVGLLVGP